MSGPPRCLPIPVLALAALTLHWASTVAEPPGHESYEGARGTRGDRSLPAVCPAPHPAARASGFCHSLRSRRLSAPYGFTPFDPGWAPQSARANQGWRMPEFKWYRGDPCGRPSWRNDAVAHADTGDHKGRPYGIATAPRHVGLRRSLAGVPWAASISTVEQSPVGARLVLARPGEATPCGCRHGRPQGSPLRVHVLSV